MKRLFIYFLLSSFILPVMAQEDHVDQLVRKGTELRDRGCLANAAECYQNGLNAYPESAVIYFEMAYNYACMNEIEKSFECAEKAMIADDTAQELLHGWRFTISACENTKPERTITDEPQRELSPVYDEQIDQIH